MWSSLGGAGSTSPDEATGGSQPVPPGGRWETRMSDVPASRSGYDCYVELARLTFKDITSCQVEAPLRRASSGITGEGNGVPPY